MSTAQRACYHVHPLEIRCTLVHVSRETDATAFFLTKRRPTNSPTKRWLKIHDLEDLKMHLVSIVIAVLAVLFLREAVERAGDFDLLKLAAALALIIAALALFLSMRGRGRNDSAGLG